MTPFEIDILVHYYGCAADHPVLQDKPPILHETMAFFVAHDLLRFSPSNAEAVYHITERGKAWVEYICALPLPEKKWIMPTERAES